MEGTKINHNEKAEKENVRSIKGTMFSLGVVGGVIFLTYLLIYGLYMARV